MAAACVPLRSEKVHFKPTVSCSLAPNSHRISLGRKPHGGGDSSCSSSSSSSLAQERACPFRMSVIAIFACDASCSGSASRPSGGCRDGLTTRAAGGSLASLEPAISRLWDGGAGLGAVFMPACLLLLDTPPHPPPPSGFRLSLLPPPPPPPVLFWPRCNIAFVSHLLTFLCLDFVIVLKQPFFLFLYLFFIHIMCYLSFFSLILRKFGSCFLTCFPPDHVGICFSKFFGIIIIIIIIININKLIQNAFLPLAVLLNPCSLPLSRLFPGPGISAPACPALRRSPPFQALTGRRGLCVPQRAWHRLSAFGDLRKLPPRIPVTDSLEEFFFKGQPPCSSPDRPGSSGPLGGLILWLSPLPFGSTWSPPLGRIRTGAPVSRRRGEPKVAHPPTPHQLWTPACLPSCLHYLGGDSSAPPPPQPYSNRLWGGMPAGLFCSITFLFVCFQFWVFFNCCFVLYNQYLQYMLNV